MLRRFFRGRDRLADPDPKVRRDAVLALDATQARAQSGPLARLLADDPDRSVRLAVIDRIDAIDVLARVLDDENVGEAAARRIGALAVAARRTGGAEADLRLPDHPRLRALSLLHADPAQQQARIATLADPEELIAIALKDRGSLRAAVLAHSAMQTGAALALLEKRSRGADKSLNRHAREALDAMKGLQQQAAAAAQRAQDLVQALTRATTASDLAAWERHQHIYQQCTAALATYAEAGAALTRFGESLPALDDIRARLAPPGPRPTPAVRTAAAAPERTAGAPAPGEIEPALVPDPATADVDAGSEVPEHPAAATQPPMAAEPALADEPAVAELPAVDPEQAAAEAAEQAARRAAAAARQAEFDRIDQQLDAAEAATGAGQVGTARQQLAGIRSAVDALGGDIPQRLGRRLNRLGAALAELRDWQTYVTAPKREALCEAVQALVDQPLAPADQAERLKAMRAEWRELGPITQAAEGRLADRFNALAEQAFEPCRAYFAEQAEIRRANLAERERMCDQLARYLAETDWQRADMRAAEQILRTAREAWRQYLPVDRSAGRAMEARFEALQNDLYNQLKAFWDGNADAKRQIVEEAEALATEAGDLDARINRAKGLQQRWRSIGPAMPRTKDQALWAAFRAACDALFAVRDTARDSAEVEIRELAGQCAAALDAFEAELAELNPATASEAQARAVRDRARALDSLPPPLRQPLAARRSDLLGRHQLLLRDQTRFVRRARLTELQDLDAAFSQAEAGHRNGGPAPDALERCFAGRLDRQADPVPLDQLRRLTLRAEQAAGIAPPAEDESLRLEVQVQRLRDGLAGAEDESPLQLAERWCGIGPKDDGVDALRTRFFAALAARLDA